MDNAQNESQVFDALVPAPVTLVHHYVTELHGATADAACALVGACLPEKGLRGRRTLHVGAGFGADTRTAVCWGADARGLEMSADQVDLARLVDCGSPDDAARAVAADLTVQRLYTPDVIARAVAELQREQSEVALVRGAAAQPLVHRYDVLRDDLVAAAGGAPVHAVIGNIMLHWAKLGGARLSDALERFATALVPGGVAVFAVPWHFVSSDDAAADERRRAQTVAATRPYRAAVEALRARLSELGLPQMASDAASLVRSLAIGDSESAAGSPSMELVQTHTRVFTPRRAPLADVLRGQMLYEATFFTGLHARELAPMISASIDEAVARLADDARRETAATYVRFYVYRRR